MSEQNSTAQTPSLKLRMRGASLLEHTDFFESHSIQFVSQDGRVAFEVQPTADGQGIEVRAIDFFRTPAGLFGRMISMAPRAGNCIEIRATEYDKQG